jgi:hypothetical protein
MKWKIAALVINIGVFLLSTIIFVILDTSADLAMFIVIPAFNIIIDLLILRLFKILTAKMVFAVIGEFIILYFLSFLVLMSGMH